ncbi:hypothetical protein CCR75_007609 [Bremia lactucae]|uniref:Uncharacterized protein n=1 Tax=Bremia lactucae TaxID=4779 RepID=A0A976IL72_BRELC|nr:hypothetical protein CCR75_007609 [Bremia lactucae]
MERLTPRYAIHFSCRKASQTFKKLAKRASRKRGSVLVFCTGIPKAIETSKSARKRVLQEFYGV